MRRQQTRPTRPPQRTKQGKPKCTCRPPKSHADCFYCGSGMDDHICGECAEAGVDGRVIHGTGRMTCKMHKAEAVRAFFAVAYKGSAGKQHLSSSDAEARPLCDVRTTGLVFTMRRAHTDTVCSKCAANAKGILARRKEAQGA